MHATLLTTTTQLQNCDEAPISARSGQQLWTLANLCRRPGQSCVCLPTIATLLSAPLVLRATVLHEMLAPHRDDLPTQLQPLLSPAPQLLSSSTIQISKYHSLQRAFRSFEPRSTSCRQQRQHSHATPSHAQQPVQILPHCALHKLPHDATPNPLPWLLSLHATQPSRHWHARAQHHTQPALRASRACAQPHAPRTQSRSWIGGSSKPPHLARWTPHYTRSAPCLLAIGRAGNATQQHESQGLQSHHAV